MLKLWRRASNYVRHDLREIVAPSSLPDPPGLPDDPPPRTWAESWALAKQGAREYGDTWRTQKPQQEGEETTESAEAKQLREDFVFVAKGGAEGIRPYLQRLYAARVSTVQAAGREFVEGYRDGIEQARADSVIDSLAEQFWDKAKDDKHAPTPEAHASEQHLHADKQAASDLDASVQAANGRGPATAKGPQNPEGSQALSPNEPNNAK